MGLFTSRVQLPDAPPSSVDNFTDNELRLKLRTRVREDRVPQPAGWGGYTSVWRFTSDTMAKLSQNPAEAHIMRLVASQTSIPIPHIRRIFPPDPNDPDLDTGTEEWIVMDFVEGKVLREAWPHLSWCKRLHVWWTIRSYVRQLRKIPLPPGTAPGPFDANGQSYRCNGICFTSDGAGPFKSQLDMAEWFNQRRYDFLAELYSLCGNPSQLPRIPNFDSSPPLVLSHMDLHMDNLILDSKGKLWLIDWGFAGAYPAWMQYIAIVTRFGGWKPGFWARLKARLVAGNHYSYMTQYVRPMMWVFTRSNSNDHPDNYFEQRGLKVVDGVVQPV